MPSEGEELHIDTEDARAASTPNVVRWVLTISLLAAIVLLTAIWVIGAWSSDQNNQTVSAQIHAQQPHTANNGIVSDKADQLKAAKPGQSNEPLNMPNKNANGQ